MTTHCPRRVVAMSLITGNSLSLQVMVLIDKRVLKFIAASRVVVKRWRIC